MRKRTASHQARFEDLARRLRDSNAGQLFGIELEDAGEGRAVLSLRVDAKHKQVHGVVHGGIIASLADTAGGFASYMTVSAGTRIATVEMKINFLEAVKGGTLTAAAQVLRRGKTFTVVDCDVRDAKQLLVAKALMTFAIIPARSSKT
jgi:acyl-CoA thioesterase